MGLFDTFLSALGLLPISGLGESMKRSKTLSLMVLLGIALFGCFILFLVYMAGKH
ncbi:hypothetical protein [Litorilituus lipolyticus]|uniref:hypothetical protein n=1 Tax=Litorilituus lipolyticus TaxID=2491017 RepID=UPI001479473E|nr:hypothetical protein [Litorilituus lipolyticus]